MKKIFYLFCLLGSLLFFGCAKEDMIPGIVNELEFTCLKGNSESFFEGFMNESLFCYYEGIDQYKKEVSITSAFITDGPIAPTGGGTKNLRVWGNLGFRPGATFTNRPVAPLPHLKHYIFIETPVYSTTDVTLAEIFADHLSQEGQLTLRSNIVDDIEGFNITFRFSDLDEGVNRIFETSGGNQDGSYLEITELEIYEPQFGVKEYHVTFEFSCNLYYNANPERFFARIEDAVMKLQFSI